MDIAGFWRTLRHTPVVRNIALLMSLALVCLVTVGLTAIWSSQRARAQNGWALHSVMVRQATTDLQNLVLQSESGQRGYFLTDDRNFLAVGVEARVAQKLDDLRKLVGDNPVQMARTQRLEGLISDRLAILAHNLAAYRQGRGEEVLAMIKGGRGRSTMAELSGQVSVIAAEEQRLFSQRRDASDRINQITVLVDIAGLGLIALVAVMSIGLIRQHVDDLTQARKAVDAANAGLEATVARRTASLSRANEEIQRFAYIVSHDLRAPLVNVMGYTSELQSAGKVFAAQIHKLEEAAPQLVDRDAKTAVEEDVPEAIDFIRTSTAKMDRLINAILKLSREGRRILTPETLDMTKLLTSVADSVRQQADAAGAKIEIEPLPELVSDRLAVEQIFSNLVENALKFLDRTREGHIRVTGRTEGPDAVYEVVDNGRGVEAKDKERIFELFRRAGVQDRPGEGIGLAVVRSIVRRLGGLMEFESELGRGSTFRLTFPRAGLQTRDGSE